MTQTKNGTFWPDHLVTKESGALGWTPLAKALTANWWRFKLGMECFPTLIWLLGWVRGSDFTKVRFIQVAIANQQGVHRNTINRHMNKMMDAGIIEFLSCNCISFAPLMEKLSAQRAGGVCTALFAGATAVVGGHPGEEEPGGRWLRLVRRWERRR